MGVLSIKTWILLKKIFCLSTIFFLFIVMNSCNFQRKSEIDLIFEQTKKIEILAYSNRNEWEVEDNPDYFDLKYIENNNIKIKEKKIRKTESKIKKFLYLKKLKLFIVLRMDDQMRAGQKGFVARLAESLPKCKHVLFARNSNDDRMVSYMEEFLVNYSIVDLSE